MVSIFLEMLWQALRIAMCSLAEVLVNFSSRIDQLGLSMDKAAIVERLKVLCGVNEHILD